MPSSFFDDPYAITTGGNFSGYDQPLDIFDWFRRSLYPTSSGGGATQENYTEEIIATWHPPTPAVPGKPAEDAISAIPTQVNMFLNRGWNSWARTVQSLSGKSYFEYQVNMGTSGVFIGVHSKGQESSLISTFKHGIIIDPVGIKVIELNVTKFVLAANHEGAAKIRIIVQPDLSVIYMMILGSKVTLYKSDLQVSNRALYGYAKIYSSGDVVTDSVIAEGEVQFGRA